MAALTQPPSSRQVVTGVLAFFLVTCFVLFTPRSSSPSPSSSSSSSFPSFSSSSGQLLSHYGKDYNRGGASAGEINHRISNKTLGFEKVFAVGLPERSDKRDAIALTSALTGFEVRWVDGVRGETIPDKAVPFGADRKTLWETNLGSWRGHMNAIRRIVEEDLGSALIMEDDMDWDVRLKPQLEKIAQGARALFPSSPSSSKPNSPYGDDWDLMWLGHCGEVFPETLDENKEKPADDPGVRYMSRKFAIENDPTVPPRDKLTGLVDFRSRPAFTRWVHVTGAPICTFAYALSQRGARKVLFDLSVDHLAGPFDNALAGLCRRAVSTWGGKEDGDDGVGEKAGDRGLDAKCVSVTPPVFFHHKARGYVNADSDIQTVQDGQVREKGKTENIVWSARNNIKHMLMGTQMESQYE
ncbi:glycosyltransferase family 25 protein [Daldinia bambusicola]|nr:glycosyltransferase family 25 protein [Daldinia bambusicola]